MLLGLGAAAHAQGWSPQKNVEIVVPSAPGGTNDKLARAVERTLITGKLLNSTVSIVHRAGAGNQIAAIYLGQHPGDPHYLMIGTPTLLGGHITGSSKFSHSDFTPIASIFNDYMVFTVNAASPVKTGKDLIARMRTEAQAMPLGFSSALGNHHHIAAGLFMKSIGAPVRDLKPVVFKGSAEAIIAVLGGHIEMVSTGAINVAPHVAAGKLRGRRDLLGPAFAGSDGRRSDLEGAGRGSRLRKLAQHHRARKDSLPSTSPIGKAPCARSRRQRNGRRSSSVTTGRITT